MKITKQTTPPEEKLDGKLTGKLDELKPNDRVELIKHDHQLAKKTTLPYEKLKHEISGYDVELPENPDVVDLSEINKKYHMAQSYLTRVHNIKIDAISNHNMWSKLKRMLKEYVLMRESQLLVTDKILQLPNSAAQQAAVRNKLEKPHRLLVKVENSESEAKAFEEIVESKKKDLDSVITNLSRQVKVISLESSLQ